jgi:hypothetical protein
MPPTKVDKRHIKHGYLDKNAGFIKHDRLLLVTPSLMPPTKVNKRHIKHGYLDKIAGFIKHDRLLSVTPN